MEQIKNNSLVSIKDSDEHGRIIDIEEGFATVKMNGYQKIFPITMLSVIDYEHGGFMENGGKIDWGGDLGDGFTIGTDVYITDPKSLYKGKTGFVIATVGKDLLVTVSVDGIDRNCIVNKKRVQKIDEPMAKGGPIEKYKGRFSEGVKAIEKNLVGKKVPSKYQSKYGKKYNKEEAHEAATRIKGAIVSKERILNALKRKRK